MHPQFSTFRRYLSILLSLAVAISPMSSFAITGVPSSNNIEEIEAVLSGGGMAPNSANAIAREIPYGSLVKGKTLDEVVTSERIPLKVRKGLAEMAKATPTGKCESMTLLDRTYESLKEFEDLPEDFIGMLDEYLGKDVTCAAAAGRMISDYIYLGAAYLKDTPIAVRKQKMQKYYFEPIGALKFKYNEVSEKLLAAAYQAKGSTCASLSPNEIVACGIENKNSNQILDKKIEDLKKQEEKLVDLGVMLENRWIRNSQEYLLTKNTILPELVFGAGFTIGAASIVSVIFGWTLLRGKGLAKGWSSSKYASKVIGKKSARAISKLVLRAVTRSGIRTSGRAAIRTSLRTATTTVARTSARVGVRATARMTAGTAALGTVARISGMSGLRQTNAQVGVNVSGASAIVEKNYAVPEYEGVKGLQEPVITSDEDFFPSPLVLLALDDHQRAAIIDAKSYVDHEDNVQNAGLLASIFGGLIAAETARVKIIPRLHWLVAPITVPLAHVTGFTGQAVKKAGTAIVSRVSSGTLLSMIGYGVGQLGTKIIALGNMIRKMSSGIAYVTNRTIPGAVFRLLATFGVGMGAAIYFEDKVINHFESSYLDELNDRVHQQQLKVLMDGLTPFQKYYHAEELLRSSMELAAFWSYPVYGGIELLKEDYAKKRSCEIIESLTDKDDPVLEGFDKVLGSLERLKAQRSPINSLIPFTDNPEFRRNFIKKLDDQVVLDVNSILNQKVVDRVETAGRTVERGIGLIASLESKFLEGEADRLQRFLEIIPHALDKDRVLKEISNIQLVTNEVLVAKKMGIQNQGSGKHWSSDDNWKFYSSVRKMYGCKAPYEYLEFPQSR